MADIQGIYNQLNSGSQYTPLSAETFGDWSMEAGDMVTVVKDGRSYVTPIMQGDLKWDGASKVTIESVGNREREPLGRMSRRKYSGGGGGYWNSKKAFTKIAQSDDEINLIATEQRTINGKVTTLESNFSVMSDRIAGSISANGKIIASAALEAITVVKNGKRVLGGQFTVDADRIVLNGTTTINDVMTVTDNGLWLHGNLVVGTGISSAMFFNASDQTIQAAGFKIANDGVRSLNVVDVQPQGTGLRVTYADGTTWDFSKAVTLTGTWSNGTYRVVPSSGTAISTTLVSLESDGGVTVHGSYVSQNKKVMYRASDGTEQATGAVLTALIDASGVQNPISIPTSYIYTTSGSAPSGSTNATTMRTRILQAIADSETLVFRVDCGGTQKYYHMNF